MTAIAIQTVNDRCLVPLGESATAAVQKLGQHCIYLWDRHSDLIESSGILLISTCLLASKIFKSIPPLLPRTGLVILNYWSIISLNWQIKEFIKSGCDFLRSLASAKLSSVIETTTKAFVLGTNVLMVTFSFAAAVIALFGFPQTSLAIYVGMRPLALVNLALTIGCKGYDYYANKYLVNVLQNIEEQPNANQQISKIAICFLEILKKKETSISREWTQERELADRLVRQLDHSALEGLHEIFTLKVDIKEARLQALKLYSALYESMYNAVVNTKSFFELTILGYVAMGLCRAFPDSLVDMTSRWTMSLIYTDDLIRRKIRQAAVLHSIE